MYQGHRTSRGTLGFEPKACVSCVMRSPHAVTLLPRPYIAISERHIVLNNAHAILPYIPVDHYARWESHSLLMQCRESNPTITITATLEDIHLEKLCC